MDRERALAGAEQLVRAWDVLRECVGLPPWAAKGPAIAWLADRLASASGVAGTLMQARGVGGAPAPTPAVRPDRAVRLEIAGHMDVLQSGEIDLDEYRRRIDAMAARLAEDAVKAPEFATREDGACSAPASGGTAQAT